MQNCARLENPAALSHPPWAEQHHPGWNLTAVWFAEDIWIAVYENKTQHRTMVLNFARDAVTLFGSILSAWSVLINALLCFVILVGLYRDRRSARYACGHHRALALNFTLVQLAIGAFVIPFNVGTERSGGWGHGGTLCRVWLMSQLLLVAETMWSMFVMTFDRFLQSVSSLAYIRWSGWKTVLVEVVMSWAVAGLVLVPTLMSHNSGDFILEEMCAASMSPEHTLFVTLAVYVVPATLILIVSGAIAFARLRGPETPPWVPASGALLFPTTSSYATESSSMDAKPHNEYDKNRQSLSDICATSSVASTSELELQEFQTGSGIAAMMAVNVCCLITWAPFYATSVIIPFCAGHMCIDPGVWSLMIWLGYSTAGLAPLFWFVDPWVRRHAGDLMTCRGGGEVGRGRGGGAEGRKAARLKSEYAVGGHLLRGGL